MASSKRKAKALEEDITNLAMSSDEKVPQTHQWELICVFRGDTVSFPIVVTPNTPIWTCSRSVKRQQAEKCGSIDSMDINFWKIKQPIPLKQEGQLAEISRDLPKYCELLDHKDQIQHFFPNPVSRDLFHVILELPTPVSQPRIPYSPDNTNADDKIIEFETTLKVDIAHYLKNDTQLPTIRSSSPSAETRQHVEKLQIPYTQAPNVPSLLLHRLGHANNDPRHHERIKMIFNEEVSQPSFFCNTSGSGKTRLVTDGGCEHLCVYFTARTGPECFGSADLETIIKDLNFRLKEIDPAASPKDQAAVLSQNRELAEKRFLLVLCVRLFILRIFLECASETPTGFIHAHKKRWLLLQIASTKLLKCTTDIFIDLSVTFAAKSRERLKEVTVEQIREIRKLSGNEKLYIVLDEAQTTSELYLDNFRSKSHTPRPVLREIVSTWKEFVGHLIITGTGVSKVVMEDVLGSLVAKVPTTEITVTNTGAFDDADDLIDYLADYLEPEYLTTQEGRLLASRAAYWLHGRYRFTASFIVLLIQVGFQHPHWVLNEYVERMSSFRPSDYYEEAPPSVTLGPVLGFDFQKLTNDPALLRQIAGFVFDYVFKGTQRILGNTDNEKLVEYGFARFQDENHLVADEPLALLAAVNYFNSQTAWTLVHFLEEGLTNPDPVARGIAFEYFGAYMLAGAFRSSTRLSDVFTFCGPDSLSSETGRLVAVHQEGGQHVINPVDILSDTGPSYHLGCRHSIATDTLEWLRDPRRIVFCFPAKEVGPDLILILELSDGRLLRVLVQFKQIATKTLTPSLTKDAIRTTNPDYFLSRRSENGGGIAIPANETSGKRVSTQPELAGELQDALKQLGTGTTEAGDSGVLRVLVSYPAIPNKSALVEIATDDPKKHPIATVDILRLAENTKFGEDVLKSLTQRIAIEAIQRKERKENTGSRRGTAS